MNFLESIGQLYYNRVSKIKERKRFYVKKQNKNKRDVSRYTTNTF